MRKTISLALLASALLCTFPTAFAGQILFGFELSKPLTREISPCRNSEVFNRTSDYCVKYATNTMGATNGSLDLQPPDFTHNDDRERLRIPSWVKTVRITIFEGKIAEIQSTTAGIATQPKILEALAEKFGTPVTRETVSATNGFGAPVFYERATWVSPESSVISSCVKIDSCFVVLQSPDYFQEMRRIETERKAKDKL